MTASNGGEMYALRRDHALRRAQIGALGVGAVAALAAVGGALASPREFFQSYLVGYMFWTGIALGCMVILMLHHITGGMWGAAIRRFLEAGTRTLPLMAVLFVPVVLGIPELYEWSHADRVARDPILQHKSAYLNVPFFIARAMAYFAIWNVVAVFLIRWSDDEDRVGEPATRRLQLLGRGGLVLYGLSMTFAAVDWLMSIDPHWFSTMYGLLLMAGQVLSALAFAIAIATAAADRPPLSEIISGETLHDLGKLLLAFVLVWSYLAFSQFLIIWSGNLPEETPWYLQRLRGGWQLVGAALIAGHFALPFVVLLSRDVKRRPGLLAAVAVLVVGMRLVDLFWLVKPGYSEGLRVHWTDAVVPLAIGGLWFGFFVWQLGRRPLLPLQDASLPLANGGRP